MIMGRYREGEYTTKELAYICRFYSHDGPSYLGMALNRSSKSISEIVQYLKKNGEFDHYHKLWDTLFEKGIGA
jgi:hypothetical protein